MTGFGRTFMGQHRTYCRHIGQHMGTASDQHVRPFIFMKKKFFYSVNVCVMGHGFPSLIAETIFCKHSQLIGG